MADNTTTGTTGVVIATADRAGVHFQKYLPSGGASGTHGAYTVTTTPTAHVSANAARRYVILQNQGSVNVFYGYTSSIGAGLSNYIAPGDSLTSEVTAAIYLAAASGTATVTYDQVTN